MQSRRTSALGGAHAPVRRQTIWDTGCHDGLALLLNPRRAALVEQAALSDGCFLDPHYLLEDSPGAAVADVGGCNVAEAPVDPVVVVMIDEVTGCGLERSGEVVVFGQDPVGQGLVPAFDCALHLRMVQRQSLLGRVVFFRANARPGPH